MAKLPERPSGLVNKLVTEDETMLVLSRKEGEQLIIDDNIVITVTRLAGHRVSIGIQAPPDIRIIRGEFLTHDRKDARREAALVGA